MNPLRWRVSLVDVTDWVGFMRPVSNESTLQQPMFAKAQTRNFIGIGGIGMSGIAEFCSSWLCCFGSDLRRLQHPDALLQLGATHL